MKNRTPHLDHMAQKEMKLTSFYAAPDFALGALSLSVSSGSLYGTVAFE
jgi:hypothetical protein